MRKLLRTAAADAIVLLKNEKSLLPLTHTSSKPLKKIAVIGPNAKIAMTSGGGSARLRSTYTVSPLEGIVAAAKQLGDEVEVTFALGALTHRYLPVVDLLISQEGGALVEFWNESPTDDWTSVSVDLGREFKESV